MFKNLHYLGISESDRTPYLYAAKVAEAWPIEGLRLYFYSKRMERAYALSYWLNYSSQNPLPWLRPSEDAWVVGLDGLKAAFIDAKSGDRLRPQVEFPNWFCGEVTIAPEWTAVDSKQGHNYFSFFITEWQVTKSKLPPVPGVGLTIIQGDQIHMSDIHGNIGHVGSHSSNFRIEQNSDLSSEDLASLANELALLRAALRQKATTVDDDRTVATIGDAEEAARKGDRGSTLAFLKKAGAWAFKTAAEIGTPVAQKALEAAAGV